MITLEETTKDLVYKALNALSSAAIDGRASWVTGHVAKNNDGSVTVAFRHKHGKKTATFTVDTLREAIGCCQYMRSITR